MRDKRFVAVHRDGSLTEYNHRQLIRWARECSEYVLSLLAENIDERLIHALHVAKEWEKDTAKVGDAMKASLAAHAVARESVNATSTAVARSVGQAVATAHMADHSLGAALYALKAVKHAGKAVDEEREWQNKQLQQLPAEMVKLVSTSLIEKEKAWRV